ncbi:Ring finger protein [Thalictrum thalictroides]|uniref:Ring finger protein n=1 Tax=Thalictrum thalictroides TaxID=46969 RepID=A0A7J6WGF8_THATH|nr:Ring finger protein [Thalictrum thalictroides]
MRQTHAVKECLHRFCKECIDKSMRVVNRECPACRKHLPSKRTLRKDTRYDRIIQEFYPNINDDNYGEMDLDEEERAQNDQMQTSFAETFQRQTDALPRRLAQQTPLSSRSISQGTDDDEDGQSNDGVRDSSSADQSFSPSDNGWELNQNDEDGERTIPSTEVFKWGRNGQRSQTRRDIGSSSTRKSRGKHLAQVTKRIDNIRLNPEEVEISVALIPLNEHTLPSLESPYITCPSIFSVKQLRQYVANQMGVQVKEVEISLVTAPTFPTSGLMPVYDPARGDLQLLQSQETVGALHRCYSPDGALVMGYQRKLFQ